MPIQTAADSISNSAGSPYGFKNRIINGAMVIDQRNAGASVASDSSGSQYTLDRWNSYGNNAASKFTVQQNAGSVTPPAEFKNYLGITSSSAHTLGSNETFLIQQTVEGYNIADLDYGSSTAKTATLSFWVRSSLTGTFGGSITNSAFDFSYPYSYTISSANTWEYKTITIPGAPSGTWLTTNGLGMRVTWSLGSNGTQVTATSGWQSGGYRSPTTNTSVVSTNGATFYITGVQFEKGSQATAFDYRPYGAEFALCQRYFEKSFEVGTVPADTVGILTDRRQGVAFGSTSVGYQQEYKVSKRTAPSMTLYKGLNGGTNGRWGYYDSSTWVASTGATITNSENEFRIDFTVSGRTFGQALILDGNWTASAEL
jgi:hypothetical protein